MVTILNIRLKAITQQQLLADLKEGVLFTPNIDHLVKLQHDKAFWEAYQQADWVVCDSRVLYLALKLAGKAIPEAIPGSSFFTAFYKYHKDNLNCKIFLLGAKEGVATKAMQRINEKVGREIIVGALSPSFGFEQNAEECAQICNTIQRSKANVVLVGVGAPKQEKWIVRYKDCMPNVRIWMALGATIDFEAGQIKRAPHIFQKLALEWLYRIYCEPKRMFKRYFSDLSFFILYFKALLGLYKNPFQK